MAVEIRILRGAAMQEVIASFAALRVTVFREFPYLYDGDPKNEARYLAAYGQHPQAILVGAWDGDRLVGAATGMPLSAHGDAAALRLPKGDPQLGDVYYCAESVLLPEYRGQGIGHAFFDHREAQARDCGFGWTAFAAVIRPETHPLRPETYRPLDGFWRKRGYAPLVGSRLRFDWTDIDQQASSSKELQLWLRRL